MTWGQVRRRNEKLIAARRPTDLDVITTHYVERAVAEQAYIDAGGRLHPGPLDAGSGVFEDWLNDAYVAYGLSSGRNQTREMVRSIQQQAAKQVDRRR